MKKDKGVRAPGRGAVSGSEGSSAVASLEKSILPGTGRCSDDGGYSVFDTLSRTLSQL